MITDADKVVFSCYRGLHIFAVYIHAYNTANLMQIYTGSYGDRTIYPECRRALNRGSAQLRAVYYEIGRTVRFHYMFVAGAFVACAPVSIHGLSDWRYHGAAMYLGL